jgi:hypothetical protein
MFSLVRCSPGIPSPVYITFTEGICRNYQRCMPENEAEFGVRAMAHFARLRTISRWIWLSLGVVSVAVPTALHAASVRVSGEDPRQVITVTIEEATVDFVLEDLHKKYGFEVLGPKNGGNIGELQTVTLSGSLQGILERLLRNWNHVIVHSPDNASGITKVMILNSVYGAPASSPAPERASGAGAPKTQNLTGAFD